MTTSNEKSYFDLHITGLGYLNRIREVKPKKGEPFLACDIAALNGPSNAPEYRRFDVRVSGSEAQHLVRRCEEAVKAEPKPTETDERDPEVPVTSDAPAAQQASAPEPSEPLADAADDAADAPALAVAEPL